MQKIDKFAHRSKVIAICLPAVIMALTGLAQLSGKKGGSTVVARKQPAPAPGPAQRSGTG
jgi:hypothetical protein